MKWNRQRQWILAVLLLVSSWNLNAQDKDSINNRRLKIITVTGAGLYTGAFVGLYHLWYKNYPQSSFHFINDNDEWMQMDKAGHTFTSYYEGVYGIRMLEWAGVPSRKAAWYGGLWGMLMQTPFEVLDGFSAQWGASTGDIIANSVGTAMVIGQHLKWQDQRLLLKFSFSPSPFAQHKPKLLGSSLAEQLFKDYNGQTYWLSGNILALSGHSKIPPWLNLSVGYGADGLLRGTREDQENDPLAFNTIRSRQFYLSPDVDLSRIKTRSKVLGTLLDAASFIKIPAPTLEYHEQNGFRFHWLYF
ncbi:MAG: YfiM family protein [Bacteroidota bacterium]|nr:YfiM family protein [Bacteroidota bacterium]